MSVTIRTMPERQESVVVGHVRLSHGKIPLAIYRRMLNRAVRRGGEEIYIRTAGRNHLIPVVDENGKEVLWL